MKKVLIIVGSIAGVIVVVLAAAIFYVARLDPNNYKDGITSGFETATGRALHLDGPLTLTLYPWLGLGIDQLSIANAPGFGNEPLVSVAHAEVRAKLLPLLLHDQYEIDTVKVSGVRVNLQVDDKGSNNWTLATKAAQAESADSNGQHEVPFEKLVIGGVDIGDTRVVFDDRQNNLHYELERLDLHVGTLQYGKPLDIAATLRATSRQPALQADIALDGKALYDNDSGLYQLDPLQLKGTLQGATVPDGSSTLTLATSLKFDSHQHTLALPDLQFLVLDTHVQSHFDLGALNTKSPTVKGEVLIDGKDLSQVFRVIGNDELAARIRSIDSRFTASAKIDKQRDALAVPTLKAELLGATIDGTVTSPDGSKVQGTLKAQGPDLPTLVETLAFLQGGSKNPLAQTSHRLAGLDDRRFAVDIGFSGDQRKQHIDVTTLQVTALGLKLNGTLSADDVQSKPRVQGKLSVPPFNARAFIAKLDPQRLQTKDPSVLQRVGFDTDFDATPNSVTLKQLALALDDTRMKGSIDISDLAKLKAGFDLDIDTFNADRYLAPTADSSTAKAQGEPAPLPVDDLRKLDLHGKLRVGQLVFSGLKLSNIEVPLDAANGVIALAPMKAALYGGAFDGKIGLDVTGAEPVATVASTLSKIDLGPLEQDLMHASYVAGKGNVELQLEGRGKDSVALRQRLNGSGKLQLDQGVLSGIDIGNTLTTVETMIRARRLIDMPKGGETRFDTFAATLAIKDSVVNSNDLLIKAPGWQVSGAGKLADLRNETLDFTLTAKVDPTTATVGTSQYNIGGHQLPITCSGKLMGPSCKPDVKAILSATLDGVKDSITSLLKKEVDKRTAPQQQPADKNGAQQPPDEAQPEQKPRDQVINLLKGALKR